MDGAKSCLTVCTVSMMAQNPLKMEIVYDDNRILVEQKPEDLEAAYLKNAKKCFMPYSWAVWLTSFAREDLQKAIDATGRETFLYCDTDSIKHLENDVDYATLFPGDSYVAYDIKGRPHRMGVLERDDEFDEFVTLGAKKYAVKENGKITITVAGVGKVDGSRELEAAGGLDAFKPGMIFQSGGIDAVYNDFDDYTIEAEGHLLHVTRNVSLVEGIYTLGLSDSYSELLDAIANERIVIDPFDL